MMRFGVDNQPTRRRGHSVVGGRERARSSRWLIRLTDGVELELEGPFMSEGHARSVALDYMEKTNRPGRGIVESARAKSSMNRSGSSHKRAALPANPSIGQGLSVVS